MPSFDFRESRIDSGALELYSALFDACFPGAHHLTANYLRWLYADNPCGRVVGFDALDGDTLAAHYACIPSAIMLRGVEVKALLSLNTATHPKYQGRGLFTKLADLTYEAGFRQGFSSVYGVANANSTPGFLRKLGFQHVASLDAKVGLGRPADIDWAKVGNLAEFRRTWTLEQLHWRVKNPANPVGFFGVDGQGSAFYAKTGRRGILAWDELPVAMDSAGTGRPGVLRPRLFLGLHPEGAARVKLSIDVPGLMRPSPLNFIHRSLRGGDSALNPRAISFGFMDFDAY